MARCRVCGGSGKAMGGGCIMTTCDACTSPDQKDKLEKADITAKAKLDKRSKEYKKAIADMMEKTGLDKEDATKLFDSEMDKL